LTEETPLPASQFVNGWRNGAREAALVREWLEYKKNQRRDLDRKASDPHFRDFIKLCLLTGQRKSNVLAMRWDDIDFKGRTWTIPGEKMKNSQSLTYRCASEHQLCSVLGVCIVLVEFMVLYE